MKRYSQIAVSFFLVGLLSVSVFCEASTKIETVKRSAFGTSGKTLETLLKHHPAIIQRSVQWSMDSIPIDIIDLNFDYRTKKSFFSFKKQKPSHLEISFTVYENKASFLSIERNESMSDVSDLNFREFIRVLEKKKSFDEMLLLPPQPTCGTPFLKENQPPDTKHWK